MFTSATFLFLSLLFPYTAIAGFSALAGFLRPGIQDDTASNFGLLDQIASLLWLRENVARFGGNPNNVTLVGHGTGATFANLLLISPVANKKGKETLIFRALRRGSKFPPFDATADQFLSIVSLEARRTSAAGLPFPRARSREPKEEARARRRIEP